MTYQRITKNCFKLQRNLDIINKEYRFNQAEAKSYMCNIDMQDKKV